MERETRFLSLDDTELRADHGEGDDPPRIMGTAAVFDRWGGGPEVGFWERIAPGAFRDAIADGADVVALKNHNPDHVLGRTTAGTLELREAKDGLRYVTTPADTSAARDTVADIRAGNIRGNSFSFAIAEDGDTWEQGEDGVARRTIHRIAKLYDVGPVTFPFYDETTVSSRARDMAAKVTAPPADRPRLRRAKLRDRLTGR